MGSRQWCVCHFSGVPSSWVQDNLRDNTGIDRNIVCSRVGAPRYLEGIYEATLRGRRVGMPDDVAHLLHKPIILLSAETSTHKVRVFAVAFSSISRRRKLAWIYRALEESRARRPHRYRCCRLRWQRAYNRQAEPSPPQLQCRRCLSLVLSESERICQQ